MRGLVALGEGLSFGGRPSLDRRQPTASGSGVNVRRRVQEIEAAEMLELVQVAKTTTRSTHRASMAEKAAQTTAKKRTTSTTKHRSYSSISERRVERSTSSVAASSTKRHSTHSSTSHSRSTTHSTRRHTTTSSHHTSSSKHHSTSKTTIHSPSYSRSSPHSTTHRSTTHSSIHSTSRGSSSRSSTAKAATTSQSSISFARQAPSGLLSLSASTSSPATASSAAATEPGASPVLGASTLATANSVTPAMAATTSAAGAPLTVTNTAKSRLSAGSIAGATIGSLLGAALLLILLGFCLLTRRKRRRAGDSGDWGAVPSSSYEYERDMRQTGSVLWGGPGGIFGSTGGGRDTARSRSSFIAGPRWSARDGELDPLTAPGNMSPVDREFPSEPGSAQTGYSAPFAAYGAYRGPESPRKAEPTTPTDWEGRGMGEAGVAAPPATLASPHKGSNAAPAGLLAALFGPDHAEVECEEELNEVQGKEEMEEAAHGIRLVRTQTRGSWEDEPAPPNEQSPYGTPKQYAAVSYDSPTRGGNADFSPTKPLNWTRKPSTPGPMPALLTPDEEHDDPADPHREAWLWASPNNRVSEMGLVKANPKRGSLVDRRFNSVRSGTSAVTEGSAYSDESTSRSSRGGTPNLSELFYTTPRWTGTKVGEQAASGPVPPQRRRVKLPSLPSTSSNPFVRATTPNYPVLLPPSPPQSFESQKRSDTPGNGTIDRIAASFAATLTGLGRPLRGSMSSHSHQTEHLLGSELSHGEHSEYLGMPPHRFPGRPGTPPAALALGAPRLSGNRSPHGGLALPAIAPIGSPASSHRSMSGLGHGTYRTPWMRAPDKANEGWAGVAARQGPVSPPRPPKSELRKQHKPQKEYLSASGSVAVESPPLSSPEHRQDLPSPVFPDYTSYFSRTAPQGSPPTEQPFVPPSPGEESDRPYSSYFGASPEPDSGRMMSSPPALPLPPPPAPGKRWTIRRGTLGGESDAGGQVPPPMWRTQSGMSSNAGGRRNDSVSSEGWQTDGSSGIGSWESEGGEGGDGLGWQEVDVGVPVRRG